MTVERPLRLRYQMTTEDKARFLDACPHLLDDVQAIDKALGREPQRDWNAVWGRSRDCSRGASRAGRQPSRSSSAASSRRRIRAGRRAGQGRKRSRCTKLRARSGPARFRERAAQGRHRRLLRARGAAACAGRLDGPQKDKVGYEINFNRHFYKYTPPRPLDEIDADLKQAEDEILRLLREVTV